VKYFAHLCNAQDDDKHDLLFDRYKFEGYGVYWWLCENVGKRKKTANDNPEYLFNMGRGGVERGTSRKRIAEMIGFMHDIGLLVADVRETWISVKIPKLNEYSAEWQKRLAKANSGETREPLGSDSVGTRERLGPEVVDRKKRKKDLRQTPPHSTVESVDASSEIEDQIMDQIMDPKARAEAIKTIKKAMGELPQQPKGVRPEDTGNGTIPRAEGQEVEDMGLRLESEGFSDPMLQDILDAWWAYRKGTHNEYALAAALDKHGLKGQDRVRVYQTLGVV